MKLTFNTHQVAQVRSQRRTCFTKVSCKWYLCHLKCKMTPRKAKNRQSRSAGVQSKGWNGTGSYHSKKVQKHVFQIFEDVCWCEATPRKGTQDHATSMCWFVVLGSLSAATFENIALLSLTIFALCVENFSEANCLRTSAAKPTGSTAVLLSKPLSS